VLREACQLAAREPQPVRVAVNVSAVQLCDPRFDRLVHQILVDTGLSPARLELELTETALITHRDRALHAMRRLKALGVQIAVDDFGWAIPRWRRSTCSRSTRSRSIARS
jgi:EAL domain-containing protein (putative c-di-GMP-specific phosphodiesterase class I)